MKTFLIVLLMLLNVFTAYVSVRCAAWSQLVASPYMEALKKESICHHDVIINSRLPILERAIGLPWAHKAGVLDTSKCDEADKYWKDYENSRLDYHSHKWIKVIRILIKL